jgi:hypothetical protein
MLPALLLVGIGHHRRVWLPFPVFLVWPFWLLGWVVWAVFRGLRVPYEKSLKMALVMGAQLSGLRVDLESGTDGGRIHVRMI